MSVNLQISCDLKADNLEKVYVRMFSRNFHKRIHFIYSILNIGVSFKRMKK